MQTEKTAELLVERYRGGDFAAARAELFAPHVTSVEPAGAPSEVSAALSAIRADKRCSPDSGLQLTGVDVCDPLVAGDYFTVSMALDSTIVGRGRVTVDELRVYYRVCSGKIVSERFFYTCGS